MVHDRPSIPADTQREILFEARHRCAVCCHPLTLEMAHIVPWRHTQDHSAENLIALCPNCHTLADLQHWGAEYLRKYKKRPCALDSKNLPPLTPSQNALVDLIVGADPEYLPKRERLRILSMIAAYLDIDMKAIRLVSVRKTKSSTITLRMPLEEAFKIFYGFHQQDQHLVEMFDKMKLLDVGKPQPAYGLQPIAIGIPINEFSSYQEEMIPITLSWTGDIIGEARIDFAVEPGRISGLLTWKAGDYPKYSNAQIRFQLSVMGNRGQTIHRSRVMLINSNSWERGYSFSMDMPRYVAKRAYGLVPYASLVES